MKWLIVTMMAIIALPLLAYDLNNLKGSVVRICDDGAEWPPYTYYKRENKKRTNEIVGYSVEVIDIILSKYKIRYKIDLLPWKRCLSEVKQGTRYQMILNATSNPERLQQYHLSIPYFRTHYYYFYSKNYFPDGLDVKAQSDLNKYAIGGVQGYSYSNLSEIDKESMIRTHNYVTLVNMLHRGRVQVFAEDIEILAGLTQIGVYDFMGDPALGRAPLPGVADNTFHMMFTKQELIGEMLKYVVDQEIVNMEKSGELSSIIKKYMK
ncbi:transporter substrate-binding domain-containing protein [Chitinivorax sp. B]|uniref:substrate-binding periplasmic protein n=1 Tax=Chitinivorax sp. B TaxID=2502235 RepID=UPI0010F52C05|nr:transporter substrate-binding domain-containing protein [Chitinivorax sp. B]